jgi:hypothetical protein
MPADVSTSGLDSLQRHAVGYLLNEASPANGLSLTNLRCEHPQASRQRRERVDMTRIRELPEANVSVLVRGPLPYHAQSDGHLPAPAERVFAHLDDHTRLAAHMNQRSWRMGWGRMNLHLDELKGRAIGSLMRLDGRVLGVRLSPEEIVTEHTPPTRKVWATVGTPRLLVVGAYQMGFVIAPAEDGANRASADAVTLTVFIDYALPDRGIAR